MNVLRVCSKKFFRARTRVYANRYTREHFFFDVKPVTNHKNQMCQIDKIVIIKPVTNP